MINILVFTEQLSARSDNKWKSKNSCLIIDKYELYSFHKISCVTLKYKEKTTFCFCMYETETRSDYRKGKRANCAESSFLKENTKVKKQVYFLKNSANYGYKNIMQSPQQSLFPWNTLGLVRPWTESCVISLHVYWHDVNSIYHLTAILFFYITK